MNWLVHIQQLRSFLAGGSLNWAGYLSLNFNLPSMVSMVNKIVDTLS